MSNCFIRCNSCVGEAVSVCGDAHLAVACCTFDVTEADDPVDLCTTANVCIGILSHHSPVLAENCMFVSSAGENGRSLEGVRLQGSSHVFLSCDWLRCLTGIVMTDEAFVEHVGCSWSKCAVAVQAVSKSKVDISGCVFLSNDSAIIAEEGAHVLLSSSQFVFNRVSAAARTASLHLKSSCCVFDAVALIFDKRSTATLADSTFFGTSTGHASTAGTTASDDDVTWLREDSVQISAEAVATAADSIVQARQVQREKQEDEKAALQIACAIKSVSSVTWYTQPVPRSRPCPRSCYRCRHACAVCNATAAAALEDEATAPGIKDTACRNVKTVKMRCMEI
jgi:hypothetical protein